MKRILTALLFVGCFITSDMVAQINFAAGAQLPGDPFNVGIQGKLFANVGDRWNVAGAYTFYLRNNRNWAIDGDVHYRLFDRDADFNLAALAGLNYTRFPSEIDEGDIGINLGGIFFVNLESGRTIYIEPKYVLSDNSFAALSGGYIF